MTEVQVPGDWQAMTDEELVAAYVAMGFGDTLARLYVAVLRAAPHPVD